MSADKTADPRPRVTPPSLEEVRRSTDVPWLRKVVGLGEQPLALRLAAQARLRKLARARTS